MRANRQQIRATRPCLQQSQTTLLLGSPITGSIRPISLHIDALVPSSFSQPPWRRSSSTSTLLFGLKSQCWKKLVISTWTPKLHVSLLWKRFTYNFAMRFLRFTNFLDNRLWHRWMPVPLPANPRTLLPLRTLMNSILPRPHLQLSMLICLLRRRSFHMEQAWKTRYWESLPIFMTKFIA